MGGFTECADEQLMRRLCDGDDEALAVLVERYQNDVFRFSMHFLGDRETAKEITQEVFLRVFTARDRFDPTRVFYPWMLRIAKNMCLNALKRRKTVPMESLEGLEHRSDSTLDYWPSPATAHPLESILTDERRKALLRTVYSLPPEPREVLVMRYLEGMSSPEIAEVLEITEGAVRTRLHRALAQLRERCLKQADLL